MFEPVEFYKDPNVRERIAEYCGGQATNPSTFTAQYLVGYGETLQLEEISTRNFIITEKDKFSWILEKGLDIFRSVWDEQSTLGVLDVEYFNLDFPGEVYLNPEKTFNKIEPVYEAILKIFAKYKIQPLVIMTGQGYHFTFRIKKDSPVNSQLEKIGKISDNLINKYENLDNGMKNFSIKHTLAHDGMGRVLEYVAHLVIKQACMVSSIPIVCTDTAVGQGMHGREAISIDMSMYGDPVNIRDVRCVFSLYQKHKVQRTKIGENISNNLPLQITIPRGRLSLEKVLHLRHHFDKAASYASNTNTKIPEVSEAFGKLVKSYFYSRLGRFHKFFDKESPHPPHNWEATYDYLDLNNFPPCMAYCLRCPNDNLLKPTNIQSATRILLKENWHPRHIAGLIRSKYERNYNWGGFWFRYDAATRADFYVRLFSGLIYDGIDKEEDLNCISHQEKGYCIKPWCGFNLAHYRL